MLVPDREIEILKVGKYRRIVGIDEVGRGCWAGPVAVGAYVFEAHSPVAEKVNDSKQLSSKRRDQIYQELCRGNYRVKMSPSVEIDRLGISVVIQNLIAEMVQEFSDGHTFFVIDGRFPIDFGTDTMQIIGGDRSYYSVACSSILAKVERDEYMTNAEQAFPGYGFAKHKGYGTAEHLISLQQLGVSSIHRHSYRPISKLLPG